MNLKQSKERLGVLIKINLLHNDLKQIDLAKHLQVSTSAVSQIITGKVSPNVIHFKKIVKCLRCSDDNIAEMNDLLIQIRLGVSKKNLSNNNFIRKKSVKMPVVCIDSLLKFCPAIEDLRTYVNRNCKQEAFSKDVDDPINYESTFRVSASEDRLDSLFPGSLTLLVDVGAYPKTTDIVLAKSQNNDKLQLKRFVFDDNNIYLMPFNGVADKQGTKVDNIEWMRKVLKVTVNDL